MKRHYFADDGRLVWVPNWLAMLAAILVGLLCAAWVIFVFYLLLEL